MFDSSNILSTWGRCGVVKELLLELGVSESLVTGGDVPACTPIGGGQIALAKSGVAAAVERKIASSKAAFE